MLKCREYHKESEKGKVILVVLENTILRYNLQFLGGHFVHSEY